jgi:hypothetical protein
MAATAKDFVVAEVHQGPGDLWVIGTPPNDATQRLTLDSATLTPDSVAHPSSVHLGYAQGIKFIVKPTVGEIMLDQYDAPIGVFVQKIEASIEAELASTEMQKLQRALGVGTYSTAAGYKQVVFGGTTVVPEIAIAAISPKRLDATKAVYCLLYKCVAVEGFTIDMGRTKHSMYKVKFTGITDLTRTAGRQIGIAVETI